MDPRRIAGGLALALVLSTGHATAHRSAAARLEFKREHPCPSTGQRRGSCPGYVIDHVQPLCVGGPDIPNNMQWQTLAEAKKKDRLEVALCRLRAKALRRE